MVNTIVRIGGQTIVLPLVLRNVDGAAMGLWYSFLSVLSISVVFDALLSGAITRLAAAYASGMPKEANGVFTAVEDAKYNTLAIESLVATVRFLSISLSIVYGLALFLLGRYWLIPALGNGADSDATGLWNIAVLTASVGLAYGQSNNILRGLRRIEIANKHIIVAYLIQLSVVVTMLLFRGEIFALAIGLGVGPVITEHMGQRVLRKEGLKLSLGLDGKILAVLVPSGVRVAGMYFGGYLFTQSLTLAVAQKMSLEAAGRLGLSLQIFKIIAGLSGIFAQNRAPLMTQSIIQGNKHALLSNFYTGFAVGGAVFASTGIAVGLIGNQLLVLIGSKTLLLGGSAMVLLILFKFTEYVCDQCTSFVMTFNSIPFAVSSIGSGLMLVGVTRCMESASIDTLLIAALMCFWVPKGAHAIWMARRFMRKCV